MTLQYTFRRHFEILENGCWVWLASKLKSGYGQFHINRKTYLAHRVSMYLYRNFNLDSEEQINHKSECNNPSCVNPDHLYIGTQEENMRDKISIGNHHNQKKTHCPQGHEYTVRNILNHNNGDRRCRICCREKTTLRRQQLTNQSLQEN